MKFQLCYLICLLVAGNLFPSPTFANPLEAAQPAAGSGQFDHEYAVTGKRIKVHYHQPKTFTPASSIVMVMPGGGRNGDTYRDTWIEKSEQYGVLVLSPSFDEAQFPSFIPYNLAGLIDASADPRTLKKVQLNPDSQSWLFAHIEAIFDAAVKRFGSTQQHYDLFGHSAGGQIVHRMALFAPTMRVHRALAANSGWYTMPETETAFPYGLKNAGLADGHLRTAFARPLTIFLGALDNASERRGHLRRTPETVAQGPHRLARGQSFYAAGQKLSDEMGTALNWSLHVVPGVGHDYRLMGQRAADYLYGTNIPEKQQ